jgi:superfamily II helicase
LLQEFIKWAKNEVHEKWSVILALEKGFLVHHGQLPMGIRMLELDLFNSQEIGFDKMLCTATLLEGVNTTAENIIITKAARNTTDFDAFDFYNLVGRTGRLFQHYLGKAYYIKGPADRDYVKSEALKSIEFELTSESIDIDINKGNYQNHPNFIDFLNNLEITYDIYKQELASRCRFSTVQYLYSSYRKNKQMLMEEIDKHISNPELSKLQLIRCLYDIIETNHYKKKLKTFIINRLTYKNRQSVKQVIDATMESYSFEDVQLVIKETLDKKNSYIEYTFYKKVNILLFFMECENETDKRINLIRDKLLRNIEYLYYINMPSHKMLKEMGIYDMDIQGIINVIGDDFETVDELQKRLRAVNEFPQMSVISRYVLYRLIR